MLQTDFQNYIALSRYAKWQDSLGRRETWEESVDRYVNFMYNQAKNKTGVSKDDLHALHSLLGATCDE